MDKITITIIEPPEAMRQNYRHVGDFGKYVADITIGGRAIRVFATADPSATKEDKLTKLYAQVQMIELCDQIRFCCMAIADGRVT